MLGFNQRKINIPSVLKIDDGEIMNIGRTLSQAGFNNAALYLSDGIEKLLNIDLNKLLEDAGLNVSYNYNVNEIHIETIIQSSLAVPKSVEVIVAVGGGKAIDYGKYSAHILGIPSISVPASVSNDGFCSPFSSLLVKNKRTTVKSSMPYGVIVDTKIIQTSPDALIYSGLGDLISKITAGYDWQQAAIKTSLPYNDFAQLIAQNTVTEMLENNYRSIRDPKFIRHLATSLLMNGISMEIAQSSRPASGAEHLISHALDQISQNPQLHGIQVGVATYVCSFLQNNNFESVKKFLIEKGFIDFVSQNPLKIDEFIEAIRLAPSIKENFSTILTEKGNIKRAIDFITSDSTAGRFFS